MNIEKLCKVTKGYAPIWAFKKGDKVIHYEADQGFSPDGKYLIASNPRCENLNYHYYTDFEGLNSGEVYRDIMYPGDLLLFRFL